MLLTGGNRHTLHQTRWKSTKGCETNIHSGPPVLNTNTHTHTHTTTGRSNFKCILAHTFRADVSPVKAASEGIRALSSMCFTYGKCKVLMWWGTGRERPGRCTHREGAWWGCLRIAIAILLIWLEFDKMATMFSTRVFYTLCHLLREKNPI